VACERVKPIYTSTHSNKFEDHNTTVRYRESVTLVKKATGKYVQQELA